LHAERVGFRIDVGATGGEQTVQAIRAAGGQVIFVAQTCRKRRMSGFEGYVAR